MARVRPDSVDLSDDKYKTLVALPEDLRRLAGQLRELKVESTDLEALPAWVGELSRLEMLRVGVKEPWREKCPIRELPASLGALTRLQMLTLRGCEGLTELPASLNNPKANNKRPVSVCPPPDGGRFQIYLIASFYLVDRGCGTGCRESRVLDRPDGLPVGAP